MPLPLESTASASTPDLAHMSTLPVTAGQMDLKRCSSGDGPCSGAYMKPKRAAPHLLRSPIHRRTLPSVSGGPGNPFPWTETGSRCASAQWMLIRRCPRNGKRARDRVGPLCHRHGKVRSWEFQVHSRVRRPAGDTHSATRVGRCQTGYDICVSQPAVVSARSLRAHLGARGVCRSRQMKILLAAAFPLETGAVSLASLQEHDFILAILARINGAAARRPRPLTANSVGTLPDTPRLEPR